MARKGMEESLQVEVRTAQGRGVWHSPLNMSSRGPVTHFLFSFLNYLQLHIKAESPDNGCLHEESQLLRLQSSQSRYNG